MILGIFPEFAEEAARVLNGNCIKVHLFDGIEPPPAILPSDT